MVCALIFLGIFRRVWKQGQFPAIGSVKDFSHFRFQAPGFGVAPGGKSVCTSKTGAAVVKSIVDLAKAFDMTVIAEGIETWDQHDALRTLGCDFGQGYLYGKPMDAATLTGLLAKAA